MSMALTNRSIGAALATKRGKDFEDIMASHCLEFEKRGRAKIHKVDPPSKVIGKGKVVYQANPFLDFIGTWTESGNRSLMLEAKSTSDHLLPIDTKKGGLTTKQIDHMRDWARAGTVTAVVWFRSDLRELKVVNFETIDYALAFGHRSMRWEDQPRCIRGTTPWLRFDILAEMANQGL
jgi:hypothetical protein